MSLHAHPLEPIPEMTARIAKAAFPKGMLAMHLRDALGPIYQDVDFAALFPKRGRAAVAPWRLALVTVLQALEQLSDRQAAEMVRARLDWKYALSLSLDDTGFDASLLTDFRQRLVEHQAQDLLLDPLLQVCRNQGWLKAGGKERSDSTMVLAHARQLSSLECVGEAIRTVLEEWAECDSDWLLTVIDPQWCDRYVHRFDLSRFPKGQEVRERLIQEVGEDGWQVLQLAQNDQTPHAVQIAASVALLKQIWHQHYEQRDDRIHWRDGPAVKSAQRICSPHEPEARESCKRSTEWLGYKVHLTETCGQDEQVNLIVDVQTTAATQQDVEELQPMRTRLRDKNVLPNEHLVDMGYTSGAGLVQVQEEEGRLVGPIKAETSWQQQYGYGLEAFVLDWQTKQARCPQGQISQHWSTAGSNERGEKRIEISFATKTCRACPAKVLCCKQEKGRILRPLPQSQYEAVKARRVEQQTPAFQQEYAMRSGVEALISEGVRRHGLRQSRYRGINKTQLQMTALAAAMNLVRIDAMLQRSASRQPPRRPRPPSALQRVQLRLVS